MTLEIDTSFEFFEYIYILLPFSQDFITIIFHIERSVSLSQPVVSLQQLNKD